LSDGRRFLRQCCACKSYKPKDSLIRITKNPDTNEAEINKNNTIYGRSVYVCKNAECISNALKKKKIESSLKTILKDSVKEMLYTVLKS